MGCLQGDVSLSGKGGGDVLKGRGDCKTWQGLGLSALALEELAVPCNCFHGAWMLSVNRRDW